MATPSQSYGTSLALVIDSCYGALEIVSAIIIIIMGSHSVTCHPTQVNAPHLTPAMQAGT